MFGCCALARLKNLENTFIFIKRLIFSVKILSLGRTNKLAPFDYPFASLSKQNGRLLFN
jgi:hypothetical protein